jgi:hypothetical protein
MEENGRFKTRSDMENAGTQAALILGGAKYYCSCEGEFFYRLTAFPSELFCYRPRGDDGVLDYTGVISQDDLADKAIRNTRSRLSAECAGAGTGISL